MQTKSAYQKIIFGLKIKQLRQNKKLSFGEFSERTGISVSYLNEIEKGKKYPKDDKIALLASVLEVTVEEICSENMSKNLSPLGDLLNSNFLNELPLDLFGIDFQKVVEIIAEAPIKVGAFISTLVEIGRNYALREENFYYRALRAYQELHNNYFEEIEIIADQFIAKKLKNIDQLNSTSLSKILSEDFNIEIVENGLDIYPELRHFRSIAIPQQNKILLNGLLNEKQKTYQIAKEIGFKYLNITNRNVSGIKAQTFEEVLSNYKAAYFAVAILIPREQFVKDLQDWFNTPIWDANFLAQLLEKYQVSPETLFQRFNVLPKFFGIDKLFFIRFIHNTITDEYEIDKELHLHHRHHPHSNGLNENYCRRWASIQFIKSIKSETSNNQIIGVQRSRYTGTNDEYLCFTIARPSHPSPNRNVSVTIGLQIDNSLRKKIKFLQDIKISTVEVGVTCQRCSMPNCEERVAAPIRIEERTRRKRVQDILEDLSNT